MINIDHDQAVVYADLSAGWLRWLAERLDDDLAEAIESEVDMKNTNWVDGKHIRKQPDDPDFEPVDDTDYVSISMSIKMWRKAIENARKVAFLLDGFKEAAKQ